MRHTQITVTNVTAADTIDEHKVDRRDAPLRGVVVLEVVMLGIVAVNDVRSTPPLHVDSANTVITSNAHVIKFVE